MKRLFILAALALSACGSDAPTVREICERFADECVEQWPGGLGQCLDVFEPLILSDECLRAMVNVPCDYGQSEMAVCFPGCEWGPSPECRDGVVRACEDCGYSGCLVVYDCRRVCEITDREYLQCGSSGYCECR